MQDSFGIECSTACSTSIFAETGDAGYMSRRLRTGSGGWPHHGLPVGQRAWKCEKSADTGGLKVQAGLAKEYGGRKRPHGVGQPEDLTCHSGL